MTADIQRRLHQELRTASDTRLAYTRRAYQALPELDCPNILDVGCGIGGPTLELARISSGHVTGLDVDAGALRELARRAAAAGLSRRVQPLCGSLYDLVFRRESLDVIWSEGSAHVPGFDKALAMWRRFIRPDGFLVAHEMAWLRPDPPAEVATCWQLAYPGMQTVAAHAAAVPDLGYDLLDHFALPPDFWEQDYFGPLELRIREFRQTYAGDSAAQAALDREQRAVDVYRRHACWYGSAFFVLQKAAPR